MAPRKLVRQAFPAPPELRIFIPFRSSRLVSGLVVPYQFSNPRSSQRPSTCRRSLAAISALIIWPVLPSITRWAVSTGLAYMEGNCATSTLGTKPARPQVPGIDISTWFCTRAVTTVWSVKSWPLWNSSVLMAPSEASSTLRQKSAADMVWPCDGRRFDRQAQPDRFGGAEKGRGRQCGGHQCPAGDGSAQLIPPSVRLARLRSRSSRCRRSYVRAGPSSTGGGTIRRFPFRGGGGVDARWQRQPRPHGGCRLRMRLRDDHAMTGRSSASGRWLVFYLLGSFVISGGIDGIAWNYIQPTGCIL